MLVGGEKLFAPLDSRAEFGWYAASELPFSGYDGETNDTKNPPGKMAPVFVRCSQFERGTTIIDVVISCLP
jgi:hypothetical protein